MFNEIQRELTQSVEICWRITATDTTIIFAKGDIKNPMEFVLDTPMGAYSFGNYLSFTRKRCDVVTGFMCRMGPLMAFGFNHGNAL
uniref:Uncharacterized protein n=3 Tax=Candidatus Kentrum eta TaxID=2126337 RepID=A0A450VKY6_9GAMM|nr:MAG: hypothetical protein BECKH772B_GA0070898_104631 [Candidatus Kentron sp. H]VFK04700.1 MAG: hypothetical protein BECKH772B_GA0070898_104781 [Candidatus Kentron sp. H]VFK04942.1 MAG: hypothetical protein BECKH772A_GA0070896_104821 [Candidatus Kentron sp. H]VFK05453.1 MAG: hypothetical protein BECKH772A_GA0070896_105521 [Candidatus Kentron sp. H]VFK07269.1 MAG: hypothetical protein BECKH772B_GA0070898_107591 [Candidatus Kentron sp. H]